MSEQPIDLDELARFFRLRPTQISHIRRDDTLSAISEARAAIDLRRQLAEAQGRIEELEAQLSAEREALADKAKMLRRAEGRSSDLERQLEGWEDIARQQSRNIDYYRGIVVSIGSVFWPYAYTDDQGLVHKEVLCATVVDAVKRHVSELEAECDDLKEVIAGALIARKQDMAMLEAVTKERDEAFQRGHALLMLNDKVSEAVGSANKQLAEAMRERDEARRQLARLKQWATNVSFVAECCPGVAKIRNVVDLTDIHDRIDELTSPVDHFDEPANSIEARAQRAAILAILSLDDAQPTTSPEPAGSSEVDPGPPLPSDAYDSIRDALVYGMGITRINVADVIKALDVKYIARRDWMHKDTQWLAWDKDGWQFEYKVEPKHDGNVHWWTGSITDVLTLDPGAFIWGDKFPGDWRDSLHKIADKDEHGLPVIPRPEGALEWAKYRFRSLCSGWIGDCEWVYEDILYGSELREGTEWQRLEYFNPDLPQQEVTHDPAGTAGSKR